VGDDEDRFLRREEAGAMMSENEGEGFILELNGSIGIKAMLAWPGRT
jgi:hypothetical protein